MIRSVRWLTVVLALAGLSASDLYQYESAIPANPADPRSKPGTAWLWIPPEAPRIRGLLLGGWQDFVDSEIIRSACASVGIGILIGARIDIGDNLVVSGHDQFEATLTDLAQQSGHPELLRVPFMPYGWSAGTVWSTRFAFAFPERCFAAMTFKGGFCVSASVPPPGTDTSRVSHLPWLHIQGQFEEFGPGPSGVLRDHEDRTTGWNLANTDHPAFRAANPDLLIGLIVDAGATHMGWNDRLYPLVAAFITASARLRLPADDAGALRAVQPADGFLMDKELAAPRFPIAPAKEYTGKPGEAHWYPDRGLAGSAAALHRNLFKKPQYVTLIDPKGAPLDVGHDMRFRWTPVFTGADTFAVKPGFNTVFVPKKYPPQEGPIGHAPGPVLARPANGCLEQIDATSFRLGWSPRRSQGWISVYHPGDDQFRYAEQIVMPRIQASAGSPQTIAFAPPTSATAASMPLNLTATSSSGLPVRFTVVSGPARIVAGNRLELAEVPRGAPRPLRIKVAAWQLGSRVAPLIAAAEPVVAEIRVQEAP